MRISRVLASCMCVFLESGGTWLVGHAYFSSLEAPDKLGACISRFWGLPWEPRLRIALEVVPNRTKSYILRPFSRKVRESIGKYEKVRESTRKSEKVRESMRKYEKVRESMRKYEKVRESMRKHEKV